MRELHEEAGAANAVLAGKLGHLDYSVGHSKRVRYFRCTGGELGALPERTHERRWIAWSEISTLPLVNEDLRAILHRSLAQTKNAS